MQKASKTQPPRQWVNVGDAQQVADKAASGAASDVSRDVRNQVKDLTHLHEQIDQSVFLDEA
jgi:hypothetical protein